MSYMDKTIEEIHEALVKGEVTSKDLIKEALEKSHEVQDKCNAFVTIMDDAKEASVTDELLSGIPYGIKDNYSTKGILSTGSSNTLKDYVPFFTATAIENLAKKGAVAAVGFFQHQVEEDTPRVVLEFKITDSIAIRVQKHLEIVVIIYYGIALREIGHDVALN